MIWELVKRETAWREVYGYIGVVAAMAIFLPHFASVILMWLVGLCWIRSQPAERASAFQAGLPIAAADLFLSRVLAFLALVWLPATAGALILLITRGDATGMLIAGASLSVLVLAPLSHRIRELAGSQWAPAISIALLSAAGWPATHYVPRPILATLCASLCVALFAISWRQLPLSFEVVSSKPPTPITHTTAPVRAATVRERWFSPLLLEHWRPVLRCAFPPTVFMFLPIIVMQNFGGDWFYASSQALFPLIMALSKISWLRGLPISRGTLLTIMVAPWLLTLALNLLVGSLLFPPKTQIQYDYVADKLGSIRPPLESWRIAPDGKAPVIESPWHETWHPPVQTVAGVAIYNPYSMGAANSRRFLEWQYRRATLAIYGREIAFNDYHPTTQRPIKQQERFAVLNVAACLCWLLILLNAVLVMMHWRTGRVFGRASRYAGFLLLLPMLTPLFLEFLVKHPGGSLGTALLNTGLLRILAAMPNGLAPVLLVGAVPLGLLWWSALRLFAGVEPHPYDPTRRA